MLSTHVIHVLGTRSNVSFWWQNLILYGCIWVMQKFSWLQGKGGTFISQFWSLSIGPAAGIKPMTSCSTVKHSDLSTVNPAPVKLGN